MEESPGGRRLRRDAPSSAEWTLSRLTAEFTESAAEAAFRARYRGQKGRQTAVSLLVMALLFLVFAYPDWVAFGSADPFLRLLAVRIAIAGLLTAGAALAWRRPVLIEDGRIVSGLEALSFAAYFVVVHARPEELAWHLGIVMTMLVGLFSFVPNRFPLMLSVATAGVGGFLATLSFAGDMSGPEIASIGLLVSFPAIIGAIAAWRFATLRRREYALLAELTHLAETDPLTGLLNRRRFEVLFAREIARAARNGTPLTLCLMDIDRFKRVNDDFGHAAGDEALRLFSAVCREGLRATDVLARFGGEEFILVLPDTSPRQAVEVLERLRARLAKIPLETAQGSLRITVTIGVAAWHAGEDRESLIRRADAALYAGKAAGRDRIALADVDTSAAA